MCLSNELLYKKMLAMLPLCHEKISRLGKQNLIFKHHRVNEITSELGKRLFHISTPFSPVLSNTILMSSGKLKTTFSED